jgi:hypothetical protein
MVQANIGYTIMVIAILTSFHFHCSETYRYFDLPFCSPG